MHIRPSAAVPPLAPSMLDAPIPRSRTSRISQGSAPQTPPNRDTPLPLFASAANRNSSDSWNSSNYDGADDMEFEWSPEQTRLLTRTLDALPAHLLTPFNGPVPPSNLLDKIARGVTQAKGPLDWPHSIRATRAKIVELARVRAKEAVSDGASDTIAEEDPSDLDALQHDANHPPKRPLYRQSSMDFMQAEHRDLAHNDNIHRLSRRLQFTDRYISNPPPLSFMEPSDCPPPPYHDTGRGTFFPSTPSSTTLNSSSSGSRIPRLRRSMSDISNSSDSFVLPAVDPRVQRVKRSESIGAALLCSPGQSLKRAPSFGATSKRSSGAMSLSGRDSDVTSSDEEEKMRSMKAKKARMKTVSPPLTSPVVSPDRSKSHRKAPASSPSKLTTNKTPRAHKDTAIRRVSKPRANLQRNPSILGGELPHPQPIPPSPIPLCRSPRTHTQNSIHTPQITDSPVSRRSVSRTPDLCVSPSSPSSQGKALRRAKGTRLPQHTIGRKITFGSPAALVEEGGITGIYVGDGQGLGSAFQMH